LYATKSRTRSWAPQSRMRLAEADHPWHVAALPCAVNSLFPLLFCPHSFYPCSVLFRIMHTTYPCAKLLSSLSPSLSPHLYSSLLLPSRLSLAVHRDTHDAITGLSLGLYDRTWARLWLTSIFPIAQPEDPVSSAITTREAHQASDKARRQGGCYVWLMTCLGREAFKSFQGAEKGGRECHFRLIVHLRDAGELGEYHRDGSGGVERRCRYG